jgi:hypothetical protein
MARLDPYDIGDLWVAQSTFTVGGVNTDPTTITVKQQTPSGTETTLASAVATSGLTGASTPVAKTATGVYRLNPGITLNEAGRWYVRFEGAGAVTASEEHEAVVVPSVFTSESGVGDRALVTLRETKDWLKGQGVETTSYENDLELVRVINDISERAHDEAKREFKASGSNPQARVFPVDARMLRQRIVDVGDLASAPTLVQVLDTDLTTVLATETAYVVDPQVREADEPIRRLVLLSDFYALQPGMGVRVTGTWGFPSVPGNVRQAVLDAIAAVMDRDVEHYRQDLGYAGANVQPGGTVVMLGGNRRMTSMPSTSLAVLWDYRDLYVG